MTSRTVALCLISVMLLGCQHEAKPIPVGVYDVYSSYSQKLRGKYLLYIDADQLNTTVKPADINCSAHSYPLNAGSSFSGSVSKSLANLVDEVEVVQNPAARSEIRAKGARGLIIVRAENISTRLRFLPGAWQNTAETEVEIEAGISVDGRKGRLLGTIVSGVGKFSAAAGALCEGGSDALTEATKISMKRTIRKLGEALTNSERVRKGG